MPRHLEKIIVPFSIILRQGGKKVEAKEKELEKTEVAPVQQEENNNKNSIEERERLLEERERKVEEQEKQIELKEVETLVLRELKELEAAEELKEMFINAAMMLPRNERYTFIAKNVETIKKVIEKNTYKKYQVDCKRLIKGKTPSTSTGVFDDGGFPIGDTMAEVSRAFN